MVMGETWAQELRNRKLHEECRLNSYAVLDPEGEEPVKWVTPEPWDKKKMR